MDSSPHSVREAITDVLPSHGWTWKDDENGVTATSIHDPECRRCKAEAALDGLVEQLEALEENFVRWYCEQVYNAAPEAREEWQRLVSNPAKKPEGT